ncbi:unnamed protein product [Mytilus coruscus]|uniref:Mab-21-like nucleotidyltransferase domain-containing protein n=1 Tax=Mytilus coruscus TaxID=42192 RepID=A0A6J8AEF3_MYTCO|nr:unnamed protein product [Mytilus coruscus]
MSIETNESMNIYKFLCQKIGSEEVVKIRRLTFAINDIGKRCQFITSGSKGEGLDLKGSDLDIMHVDSCFKVYQSENDVVFKGKDVPLILNTEETQPCFVQLCVKRYIHVLLCENGNPSILNMLQKTHMGCVLSSELNKQLYLSSKQVLQCIKSMVHVYQILMKHMTMHCVLSAINGYFKQIHGFNTFNKQKLTTILNNSYVQGINCLATSETFQDDQSQSHQVNESLISRHIRFLHQIIPTVASIRIHHIGCKTDRFSKLLYNFLHHSKTGSSKGLFALQLSAAFMLAPEETTYVYSSRNKNMI